MRVAQQHRRKRKSKAAKTEISASPFASVLKVPSEGSPKLLKRLRSENKDEEELSPKRSSSNDLSESEPVIPDKDELLFLSKLKKAGHDFDHLRNKVKKELKMQYKRKSTVFFTRQNTMVKPKPSELVHKERPLSETKIKKPESKKAKKQK